MYNTILVPIDILEDDLTDKMLPHGRALAKIDNPKIHFFTVIPNVEMFFRVGIRLNAGQYAGNPESALSWRFAALKEIIKGIAVPEKSVHPARLSDQPKRNSLMPKILTPT